MALQDSYNTGDDVQQRVGNSNVTQEAQVFTASGNYDLTSIKLKLYKESSASGTFTCELKAVDGSSKPTGSALSSGTLTQADITSTAAPGAFYEFTMTAYSLVVSTQYAIVARASTTAPNDFWWRAEDGGTGFSDPGWQSTDSGSSWADVGDDFMFEVYGTTIASFVPKLMQF